MNWKNLLCTDRIRSYQKSTISRDLRTEFEKDYHRIIGSASFRRLQDKTQVFPLDKSDYIRTRLTHSLEVSSFAKSLSQNVGERIIQDNLDEDFLTIGNAYHKIMELSKLELSNLENLKSMNEFEIVDEKKIITAIENLAKIKGDRQVFCEQNFMLYAPKKLFDNSFNSYI